MMNKAGDECVTRTPQVSAQVQRLEKAIARMTDVRSQVEDRIYVRDRRELRGNNVWRRIAHYRALRELEGMGCPPAREGDGEAGAADFPLRGRIDRAGARKG